MTRARNFWRRVWRDVVLLPLALLVVLLEDVLWRGARAVLAGIADLPAARGVQAWLGRLSGAAALPLFLVPEAAGRVGELWAAWLLYRGHAASAATVYAAVRLVAALLAVFIWQACEPALMRLAWFAWIVVRIRATRDWALARTAPVRHRMMALLRGRGALRRSIAALRRRLLRP